MSASTNVVTCRSILNGELRWTYDAGGRARLDGEPLRLYPPALGQMGVVLPAGEHRVHLAYRDSRVASGAAVSLSALLAVRALFAPARRRRGDSP